MLPDGYFYAGMCTCYIGTVGKDKEMLDAGQRTMVESRSIAPRNPTPCGAALAVGASREATEALTRRRVPWPWACWRRSR